jgi:very-short-patch-repair endonuclease
MGGQETPDARIARLAARRHGVVARAELLRAGVTRREIDRRLERGSLVAVHRGVYAVGHAGLSRDGRWMAAVLACGRGAVLSHRSAAALLGLVGDGGGAAHVTAPHRLRTPGLVVHRGRLTRADHSRWRGIPVTSPARTIVDEAQHLDEDGIERMLREAQYRGLFHVAAVTDALTRRPSRVVRELLDDLNPTQSMLEDAFLRLCRRLRVPRPRTQVRRGRRRPDFVWAEQRLVVEVDTWIAHSTPHAFQADRRLSNAVQLAGWMILRFTYTDVRRRGPMVAAQVRQALGRR